MEEPQYNENPDIEGLFTHNEALENKNQELTRTISSISNLEQDNQDLVHYKLETDKIMERIEHFLKGDIPKFNEQGMYYDEPTKTILARILSEKQTGLKYYIQDIKQKKKGSEVKKEVLVRIVNKEDEQIDIKEEDSKKILETLDKKKLQDLGYKYIEVPDEDKKPLNDYGVAEIMRLLSMYVTKETFLSRYSEDRINEILGDLGDALNDFLYCNYEKMGMDTKFKESKYIMMCLNILHVVESCYRRAIGGEEQRSLTTRSIFTGSGIPAQTSYAQNKPKWHPLKPGTW